MRTIELDTINSLAGFEGNHSDEILSEINELSNATLTSLYSDTTNALLHCMHENADLPTAIIDHFSAIRIALMQEIAKRNTPTS